MDPKVIICFSKNSESVCQLFSVYSKLFDDKKNLIDLQDETGLLSFIGEKEITQLVLFDTDNSRQETISLLLEINKLAPNSIKIIFSEDKNLLQIQQQLQDSSTFLFLSKPWSEIEFELTIQTAKQMYKQLKEIQEKKKENTRLSEKIEKNVADRLKELSDANLAKDKFLSIIAHDLKTPFNTLLGMSDILLTKWKELSEKEKLELINDLHSTSKNTYNLMESLLAWSRSQMQKLETQPQNISIKKIIDTNIKIAEKSAYSKKISIVNQIHKDISLNVDENMISTVFRNLIANAIKYTPKGGQVKISAKKENEFCTFCISDTGGGVNKPYILELFSRHYQPEENNGNENTGLGLILCKDFVERNGGKIWLETEKDKGSNFYFTLPRTN